MTERKRRLLWAASVIIAFILGFLLGRRYCLIGSSSGGGGMVVGAGSGSGGGAKAHVSPGSGQGKIQPHGGNGKVGGDTDTVGGAVNGLGGGGDLGGGGGGGGSSNIPPGDSLKKAPKQVDTLSGDFVAHMSGDLVMGDKTPLSAPPDPRIKSKTADDFSLDATQLPRYPMDVTKAFSGISTRSDKPADTGTAAVFTSTDSYDSVTSWYRSHMPAGARETNADVNQMRALAKQLTPKNLLKMLGAQAPPQQGAQDSTPPPPEDTTAQGSRIDGWQLPDDGVHGERSVLVMSTPGKPTTVLVSRSRRP